jgi:hypothetical protein
MPGSIPQWERSTTSPTAADAPEQPVLDVRNQPDSHRPRRTERRVCVAWIEGLISCRAVSVRVSFIYVQGRPCAASTVYEQDRWPVMDPGRRPSLILKSGRPTAHSSLSRVVELEGPLADSVPCRLAEESDSGSKMGATACGPVRLDAVSATAYSVLNRVDTFDQRTCTCANQD